MHVKVLPQSALPFFFSSRRRHTRYWRDWSSDVCSSDLSWTGTNYPADIHVAANGRTLYVSNRGHNSIALFSVADSGALARSEERRVGKECRSRWSPYH